MLHVDDDINDELMRKAAEDYPLNTDGADWNAVLNKMSPGIFEKEQPVERKRRRYLLLLFLLLPLFFVIAERMKTHRKDAAAATLAKNDPHGNSATVNIKVASINTAPSYVNKPQGNVQSVNVTQHDDQLNAASATRQNKNYSGIASAKQRIAVLNGNATKDAKGKSKSRRISSAAKSIMTINAPAADTDDAVAENTKVKQIIHSKEKKAVQTAAPDTEIAETTIDNKIPVKINTPKQADNGSIKNKIAETTADQLTAKTDTTAKKPATQKNKSHEKRFYVGIVGAPDISTVRLQAVKKVGVSYGAVAGYKLPKRFSIESGFIYEKKYYDTKGEYFSRKNLKLPPGLKISYASGYCYMWELPLNLNYSFGKKANSSWFATTGVSSYFMKRESYNYDLVYNTYQYARSYDYTTKSNTVIAVINFGVGYTHRIGKIGDLRIQPYVKLPVSKIGTGLLPIQSTGIYFGITKNIF